MTGHPAIAHIVESAERQGCKVLRATCEVGGQFDYVAIVVVEKDGVKVINRNSGYIRNGKFESMIGYSGPLTDEECAAWLGSAPSAKPSADE